MNARFALPIIALASVGALVTATNYHSLPAEVPAHHESLDHHHSHNAHVAFTDMSAHAVHHLRGIPLHEDALETNPEWTPDWELHTVDVIHNGHLLRIYHAMNRHNPDIRFVAIWDTENSIATAWEPAR